MTEAATSRRNRQLAWSGYALGFALGGFFDGILLHQVLQWHHLLSGIEQARQDIKILILTDGLFHLLMYVIASFGLVWLWQGRRALAHLDDRFMLSRALLGFGAWHLLDAVLSHWVLGIHRIRMDTDNPLLWDLLWLMAFGLVPLLWGLLMRRHKIPTANNRLMAPPWTLAAGVFLASIVATWPAPSNGPVMVLFAPGTTPQAALSAMQAMGAELIWTDPSQQLWAVQMSAGAPPAGFFAHGAIMVSDSIVPLGCLDWLVPAIGTAA
jgi:uncharacterized membrane protein